MSFVWSVITAVPYSNKPVAKDVVASLHSYFTCNILIAFAVIISFKHFGGRPLECMLPVGFTGAWEQYAENFCWAQDTYFVPLNSTIESVPENMRREQRISYYQWMPFFLLFQAVCFKAPTLIWKYFAGQSGMKLGEILRLASDPANSSLEVKKANIQSLCIHLQGALRFHNRLQLKRLVPHKVLRFLNVKYSSHYVAIIYMLAKSAFLANVFIQVRLMSKYLLPNLDDHFGIYAFRNLLFSADNYSSWHTSGIFPRVSMCDFEVREMGNIQKHTVQCVLVVNVFVEKVFILLWAWYVVLSAVTAISLINWMYLLCGECSKEHFLLNHLEMSETPFDRQDHENKENVDRFVHKYLGTDGVFVLRMIAAHADVVFTTELIASLWRSHYSFEQRRKDMKKLSVIWPQHEKRLEKALMEDAELAERLGDECPGWLKERKRSMANIFGQYSKSSLIGSPLDSSEGAACDSSAKTEACGLPRGSLPSSGSVGKLRRRKSIGELDVLEKVKKFADSSSEDEIEKEEISRKSVPSSRKGSRLKF